MSVNFISNVFYTVLRHFDSKIKRSREEEVGYQTELKHHDLQI